MSRIHENLPVRQFEQPDSVETAYVCKKSGLLAVDGVCTGDPRGSMAYTEYFAKGTTPTKSCDVHTAVKVCSSTGLLPTATCTTTTKIFVKRPAGSEGTTEDSAYAPPSATCKGHNILDKITDILNPKKMRQIWMPMIRRRMVRPRRVLMQIPVQQLHLTAIPAPAILPEAEVPALVQVPAPAAALPAVAPAETPEAPRLRAEMTSWRSFHKSSCSGVQSICCLNLKISFGYKKFHEDIT